MFSYLKYCRDCGELCDGEKDVCFDCYLRQAPSSRWLWGVAILIAGIILSGLIVWFGDKYPHVETVRVIDGQVEVIE